MQHASTNQPDDALAAVGLRSPKSLTVAVTAACNLTCRHCLVDACDRAGRHVPAWQVLRLAEEFAAVGETIGFTGGEPLCHPQWLTFLRRARTLGFSGVGLQTNAMLLDRKGAEGLAALDFPGLSIQVSVDGVTAASHDLVRGTGTYAAMRRGIDLLCEVGLGRRVTFFLTEMRHNLREVPALLELAERLGVGRVVTGALLPGGRAATDHGIAPASPLQYRHLARLLKEDHRFRAHYQKRGTCAYLEWDHGIARSEACTFAENPYLSSSGHLYPCVMCHADPWSVSSTFEKGLATALAEAAPLWSQLQLISELRAQQMHSCSGCAARSSCKGGCLGRAWGSSGNPCAPDDRCASRRDSAARSARGSAATNSASPRPPGEG